MKKSILLLLIAISSQLIAFSQYWQQQVSYKIDVSLNDQNNTIKGFLTLDYTNNSPDKLSFIWFHAWPNAYKNDQTAFAKQLFRDGAGKKTWSKMTDNGYMDSLDFKVNGEKASWAFDEKNIDIVRVALPKPLQPGEKINITSPFFVKLPTFISRSGHDGQSYMICQWYPKPAVYDSKGWHPIPYLEQGEFYSEFGNFDVSITVPSAYVVGATGKLQNAEELNSYKEIGRANNSRGKGKAIKYAPIGDNKFKTLNYTGENIHDFAWFADKNFIIQYDSLSLPSGKMVDVFSYHKPGGNSNWNESTSFIKDAVTHYSQWVGEYPWPTVAAVEGPATQSSGGMEYPMITLITEPDADEEGLDATITHEVGHNWFYGVLGSNERDHAWMDEGINSYFQFRYEAEKYRAFEIFGSSIPKEVKDLPETDFQNAIYAMLNRMPMESKIDMTASAFRNEEEYGTVVYLKTAVWLNIEETIIGKTLLGWAFHNYFDQWKFKHPYPEDMKASFEKTLGKNFDEWFGMLNQKGNLQYPGN